MTFQEWINQKFVVWRGDKIGREGSVKAFATYLGLTQQVVDSWINGGKIPKSKRAIDNLIARYGSEVYDILDIPQPDHIPEDEQLSRLARIIAHLADKLPPEDQNDVIEFIELRRQQAARKDSGARS